MKRYVLGIDGGGTKSHLAVFSTSGELVGMTAHGPLNHEGMPGAFEQLEQELGDFIGTSLGQMRLDVRDISYAVFGLAGVDTPAHCRIVAALVEQFGFVRFHVVNDAYLGIPAAAPGGCGICAINGTGAAVAAIDKNGMQLQVGGIGDFSDDCGGSTWYGTQVVGSVYNELFRCGPKTQLTPLLLTELKLTMQDNFAERLTTAIDAGSITLEALNRLVFTAATVGDRVAVKLLERSARSYAGSIAHLATSMAFPTNEPLTVTLAGSVFVREPCPILPALIEAQLGRLLPEHDVRFVKLQAPPVAGAVIWALSCLGEAAAARQVCQALMSRVG